MKHKLQSIFLHASTAFSYFLTMYLIFFILENIFPGFVSNTFNLNLLLIPIVILGIMSAFVSGKPRKNIPPARKDFVTVVIMTILSGVIIYYKTQELGIMALVISIVGALLVLLVATALLFAPEEKEKVHEELSDTYPTKVRLSKKRRLALIGISLIGLTLVFLGVRYIKNPGQSEQTNQITNSPTQLTMAPIENISNQIQITLIDGGLGNENIKTLANELSAYNITIQKTGEADRLDYTGGTLYFRPEDSSAADYLSNILKPIYSTIIRLPLPSGTTGIILVAGKPEISQ